MLKYIPSKDLIEATEVASFLNRPLLLAGEPGTGKTTYATYLKETNNKNLYKFYTKSVSQSKELFYEYDAVGHFANREKSAIEYIELKALGKAIINVFGKDKSKEMILENETSNNQLLTLRKSDRKNEILDRFLNDCNEKESIVLIDEIDKAPRDFPNDILNEIEGLEFEIKELGLNFSLSEADDKERKKIQIILTSNSEKNLPDAFLRRCIYCFISFPSKEELKEILRVHLGDVDDNSLLKNIEEIEVVRNKGGITKKPATSEIIDCLKWMNDKKILGESLLNNKYALNSLLKKREDFNLFNK